MTIPVAAPQLGQRELDCVAEALRIGEISGTGGRFLDRFEREFADYCNCSHGVATSNGTTALHLAVASLGIGPGDEVLVSTLTNMATFFAVLYQGATPVPIDVEEDTWNLNPALLERFLTPRTKAILVVHLYGHPADMDPILEFAHHHHLHVIEDAAEAHGALYKGRKAGSLGDVGCFSFYANKIITTGEGGMITTDDSAIAERACSLRSLAYGAERKFMHADLGFNYRMTNLQAALGCAQLEKIEDVIENKRRVARLYTEQLSDVKEIRLPVEKPYARNVYWMYHIVLRGFERKDRDLIMQLLSERGIETRPAFIPYNLQEIFIRDGLTRPELCPVANQIAESGLYLPSSASLTAEDVGCVCRHLKDVLRQIRSNSFHLPAPLKLNARTTSPQ
ncbi:MAG TPA: DegT/DnrJ/EryC1/StrS family aminotransferase [Candidatus Acidoferrales bacterium]|nr:DegT/DnrJ/EryC1/StrS family aminotransferase [Candidatus Acidoferrales bacterium]